MRQDENYPLRPVDRPVAGDAERWVLVLRRIGREPASLVGRSITPLAR